MAEEGTWYREGKVVYEKTSARHGAVLHCPDEVIAMQIVADHNAAKNFETAKEALWEIVRWADANADDPNMTHVHDIALFTLRYMERTPY